MSTVCNADNVLGQMLGMREVDGLLVTLDVLEAVDNGGKSNYNKVATQVEQGVYDEFEVPYESGNTALKKGSDWLSGDSVPIAKGFMSSMRNPSGMFGEERIQPVINFLTEHFRQYGTELEAGRFDYFDYIDDVFDGIDIEDMGAGQLLAWNRYRDFYSRGGEFYRESDTGLIGQAMNNLTSNIIQNSPTVVLGNVAEGVIKLPTLYPRSFMKGFSKALEKGFFAKIPELAEQGVYGRFEGSDTGVWSGMVGLTDIPLKNIAYYAGEFADGDGLRAVQRVAFLPRFGDLPSVYYTDTGRMGTRFLSYTINSLKMYSDLWKTLAKGNPAPLITYHALAGVMGGGLAAGVPEGLEQLITIAAPETKGWFEENQADWAKLVKPGNITRAFVTADIANRNIQGFGSSAEKALTKLKAGDTVGASLDMGDGLLRGLAFTSSPLGDAMVQRILRTGREVAEGDLRSDEIMQELAPFLKK